MTLPRTLKNFTLQVDGRGYAGRITELTLPVLSVTTEDFRAGGMDAPAQIDTGMEALECSFTLAEYEPEVLKLFGLTDQAAVNLVARGALQRNGEAAVPMAATMGGHIKEFDPGSWSAGEMTEASFTVGLRYYRLDIDGTTYHEIDIENMERKINGVDQLSTIRAAIGI
tara:strand:- start:112 stop:618 length:507 start_codon:yes stop_codon:yes gene_type:complete